MSAKTEKAVELFVRREDAERFLEEVRADDAELAEKLRLEPVELNAQEALAKQLAKRIFRLPERP